MRAGSGLLIAALVGGACAGCGGDAGTAGAGQRGGRKGLVVRTVPITTREVIYRVRALGSLEAEEVVQVTAGVTGAVTEVRFDAGDRVTPASVLALIDPERYQFEAARSEAALRRAVADFKRAEADLQRREALAQEDLVATEELARARQEAERLAADTAAARAALDLAKQNLARAEVRPSRAGVINTRTVDTGQYVQVGAVLATLVDNGRLRLRFKISGAESVRVEPGQSISFRVAALGDREFTGRVYHVGDIADTATRQIEVLAWVSNTGVLRPGSFAEIELAIERHADAVVVPESAVQASERGFVVYVVEDGTAHQRPVTVGMRTGDSAVEIVSGVKAGETLVSEGSDRLSDGIAVQAAGPDAGATPPGGRQ